MIQIAWNKRKVTIAIALCAIIAVSSIMILQGNETTQAAIINPHPGLVGWWRLDEGSGTVAGDNSGNANSGTITGAAWVTGKYGQALNFDGTTRYVSIPSIDIGTGDITISVWVKFTNSPNSGIISNMQSTGTGYLLQTNGGNKFTFSLGKAWVWTSISSNIVYNDGLFHNVVALRQSGNMVLFVDGVRQSGTAINNVNTTTQAPLAMGRAYADLNQNYFNGVIDEAKIFNRALSETEIQADFQLAPEMSSRILAKVPQDTTQVIATLSWQGTGNINITIQSPSQNYTENMLPEYQKSSYSTSNGLTSMLNIKRVSVSVTAIPTDQNWYIVLALDKIDAYQIAVEIQK
jgi:hypothetical protein